MIRGCSFFNGYIPNSIANVPISFENELVFLIVYNLFFARSTLQFPSHNWPRDIRDALCKCGKTVAVCYRSDSL